MRISMLRTALASLSLLCLASTTRADLLTANVPPDTATFSFSGIPAGSGFDNLNNQSFYVGTLAGTMDGKTFPMYCVDLYSDIHPGDTYSVNPSGDVTTLGGYDLIGRLLSLPGATTPFQGAAMQLAIWDAEYRNGDTLTVPPAGSGVSITTSLGSTSAVFDAANADLAAAKALTGGNYDSYTYLQVPSGDYGQGMVRASSVPEPASLVLAGLGLAGACGARLRRRAKGKASA